MSELRREVWEGWTSLDFINELEEELDMIMDGDSYRKPFETKEELIAYIVDHQPYYKKPIPEVNAYFIDRYGMW